MIAEKIGGFLFFITASVVAFLPTEQKSYDISVLTKSVQLENNLIQTENNKLDIKVNSKIGKLKAAAETPKIVIDSIITYKDSFIIYDTIYSFRRIRN